MWAAGRPASPSCIDGQVVYTADEATGGTHFSLVIAGSLDLSFEEAEALKIRPEEQARLFPSLRPVMEKVASIILRHIEGRNVPSIILVGGSSAFPGMAEVVAGVHRHPDLGAAQPAIRHPARNCPARSCCNKF